MAEYDYRYKHNFTELKHGPCRYRSGSRFTALVSDEITQLFILGCVTLVSEGSFLDLRVPFVFPIGIVSLVHHLKTLLHDDELRKNSVLRQEIVFFRRVHIRFKPSVYSIFTVIC